MSSDPVRISDVIDGLDAEGLLPHGTEERADEVAARLDAVQPWYVRTMVGFGAWLASLLLISFVAGFSLAVEGGYIFVGIGLVVAAVVLRRRFDNDFSVQSALAISLAGQGVLAYGIEEFKLGSDMQGMLIAIALTSSVLFVVFPDRIHRVLMVLFVATSMTILVYIQEWNSLIPFLGPGAAAALVYLYQHQSRFVAQGLGSYLRPLMSGLMLSAFGILLLSTVYILPELEVEYEFYPRPWISTLLLGALFIYVVTGIWPAITSDSTRLAIPLGYSLLVLVIAAAWAIPGLLLSLVVIVTGAASGNRVFVGAGIAFLAVFLGAYFYGIQISMLSKSATLVASGVTILFARWLLMKVLFVPGAAQHA